MCYTKGSGLILSVILFSLVVIILAEDDKKLQKETLFQKYLPNGDFVMIEKESSIKHFETPPPHIKIPEGLKLSGEYHLFNFSLKLTPKNTSDKTKVVWQKKRLYPKELIGPGIPLGKLCIHDIVIGEKLGYILATMEGFAVVEQFNLSAKQIEESTIISLFRETEWRNKTVVVKGNFIESDSAVFCFLQFAEKDYFELWKIENGNGTKIWNFSPNDSGEKK